jgi:uncharacterized protein YggE
VSILLGEKAEKIAKIAWFRLGKIVSISESPSPEPPIFFPLKEVGEESKIVPPQIEPGSQEIKIKINITFEVK